MLSKFYAGIALCAGFFVTGANTGEDVVKMMYDRYAGKWHRTLTFNQTTERYRNDSLISTQAWHETMLCPDKLRIDIAPFDNGNSIIFRGDSTYNIRNGELKLATANENDLIFLIGGMYFLPYDKVLDKLRTLGYDLTKGYEADWKGKPAYVVGVNNNHEQGNQLWIDKKDLYLVHLIKKDKQNKEEAILDNHIKINGGWTETKVLFYINDKLAQVETYTKCKSPSAFNGEIFNPQHFIKYKGK